MEVVNYKTDSLKCIKSDGKHNDYSASEGSIYFNENGDIVKILLSSRLDNKVSFSNKLYTIHALSTKVLESIPSLVLPKRLVTIDNKLSGYEMNYIDGPTLYSLLNNSSLHHEEKVDLLIKLGKILEKIKMLREKEQIEFFLNDLHERNIVCDSNLDLHVVDLDSSSIMGNLKFGSKYLSSFSPLEEFSKYRVITEYSCGAEVYPSEDTDLYCYIIIILNYLSKVNFHRLSLFQAYKYFDYLYNLGVDKELVDKFASIYSEDKNVNVFELLDSLKMVDVSRCRLK